MGSTKPLPKSTVEPPREGLPSGGLREAYMGRFGVGRKVKQMSGGTSGLQWKTSEVRWIISNPVYAGMGPYPSLVSDELWVSGAEGAIKEDGLRQFLVNMLRALRDSLGEAGSVVYTPLDAEDRPVEGAEPYRAIKFERPDKSDTE